MAKIAILGFGTVGSGVYEVLCRNAAGVSRRAGEPVEVKYILDPKDFSGHPAADLFIKNFDTILEDPEIKVVVETIGGTRFAYPYVKACLESGRSVCTSNKEMVATYGAELLGLAKAHDCAFLFEASVGGGTPIITPMHQCLAANVITEVEGIVNGTTNFMLTKMIHENLGFDEALKIAQELGYAMNARAKSLREGRSTTLAVVLPNIIDPPYAEFYTSFQHSAKKSGFKTSLYLSDNSFEKEKELIARIRSSTPYGIAAVTTYNGDEDVYAAAGFSPDEVLYISHCPTPQCSYIGFDYEACGHALGREACKYSCVALVTDDARLTAQRDCINGFLAETEGRCRVQHYQKTGTERSAAIAMDIFSADPPPEAVFVTSYGVAQTVRGVMNSFFNAPNTKIYAITPLCTLPEEDFIKYELNFRQLGNEAAQLALDKFAYEVRKYIGAYAAALGGVDCIVFTAGVGENSGSMRASICDGLEYLGVKLDAEKNKLRGEEVIISAPDSKVTVWVIPTNEELMIAQDTAALTK